VRNLRQAIVETYKVRLPPMRSEVVALPSTLQASIAQTGNVSSSARVWAATTKTTWASCSREEPGDAVWDQCPLTTRALEYCSDLPSRVHLPPLGPRSRLTCALHLGRTTRPADPQRAPSARRVCPLHSTTRHQPYSHRPTFKFPRRRGTRREGGRPPQPGPAAEDSTAPRGLYHPM
jgi:hypothetical protein